MLAVLHVLKLENQTTKINHSFTYKKLTYDENEFLFLITNYKLSYNLNKCRTFEENISIFKQAFFKLA